MSAESVVVQDLMTGQSVRDGLLLAGYYIAGYDPAASISLDEQHVQWNGGVEGAASSLSLNALFNGPVRTPDSRIVSATFALVEGGVDITIDGRTQLDSLDSDLLTVDIRDAFAAYLTVRAGAICLRSLLKLLDGHAVTSTLDSKDAAGNRTKTKIVAVDKRSPKVDPPEHMLK